MECGGKVQTKLAKTVGSSNSYCNMAKSYKAYTMQLD